MMLIVLDRKLLQQLRTINAWRKNILSSFNLVPRSLGFVHKRSGNEISQVFGSDMKGHALHYANYLLVRVPFKSITSANSRQTGRKNRKQSKAELAHE